MSQAQAPEIHQIPIAAFDCSLLPTEGRIAGIRLDHEHDTTNGKR